LDAIICAVGAVDWVSGMVAGCTICFVAGMVGNG
jgi:hypothetical protein